MIEHGDHAEEVASPVGFLALQRPAFHLTPGDEIHGISRRGFTQHLNVGRQVVRVQQRHDLLDFVRIELGQERNA